MAQGRMTDSFDAGRTAFGKRERYLYRLILCGKPGCRACPHGPYLYLRSWVQAGDRVKRVELYVGKVGSDPERRVHDDRLAREAESKRVWDEWLAGFVEDWRAIRAEINKPDFPAKGPRGSAANRERSKRVLAAIPHGAS